MAFRERYTQYVEPKLCQKYSSEHMSHIYAFVGYFILTGQQLLYFVPGIAVQVLCFTSKFSGTENLSW